LLLMAATFVLGLIIGILSTGMFARSFYKPKDGRRDAARRDGSHRGNFVQKIYKVVDADSAQARQMKPIILATMAKIDSLQAAGDRDARAAMADMRQQLTPILTAPQVEKLDKFTAHKARKGAEKGHDGARHD